MKRFPRRAALPPAPAPPFFGPSVVRAAFLLAVFGWGTGVYGPPVYLHAVVARTGWPLGTVSLAMTVHFLAGAIVIAALPRIHRRVGLPATTIAGAILTSLGVLGWALAAELWQLFAAALASGGGWVTMGAFAINAILAPWYSRSRPRALSSAYNGASVGGVVFSPLWALLIARIGFVASAVVVGLAMIVTVVWLARRVFSKSPEAMGQRPDGLVAAGAPIEDRPAGGEAAGRVGARELPGPLPGPRLWRSRQFLTLAAAMALGLFAQMGLLAHLYSLLVPALGARGAGFAMGLATVCAVAGRTIVVRTMPVGTDRRIVMAAGYAIQLLGSFVLMLAPPGAMWPIVVGIVLFGSGIGNATSLPPLIAQLEFTREDLPRAVALTVAVSQATYAFAPAVFGLLLIVTAAAPPAVGQGATAFFVGAAFVQAMAIAAVLAGRQPGLRPVR
jgi:MFS family permease